MKRKAIEQLYKWKASTGRKPLILQGARQAGKTWLMKEFANEAYKQCAYINFEDNDMLRPLFSNFDPSVKERELYGFAIYCSEPDGY